MTQKKVWRIIEAARGLGLAIIEDERGERLRIKGAASEFPDRLMVLQKALMDLDKAESPGLGNGSRPQMIDKEAAMLRSGIDGIFKWMRDRGIDTAEPYGIIEDALGVPEEKRAKHLTHKPDYGRKKGKKTSRSRNPDTAPRIIESGTRDLQQDSATPPKDPDKVQQNTKLKPRPIL